MRARPRPPNAAATDGFHDRRLLSAVIPTEPARPPVYDPTRFGSASLITFFSFAWFGRGGVTPHEIISMIRGMGPASALLVATASVAALHRVRAGRSPLDLTGTAGTYRLTVGVEFAVTGLVAGACLLDPVGSMLVTARRRSGIGEYPVRPLKMLYTPDPSGHAGLTCLATPEPATRPRSSRRESCWTDPSPRLRSEYRGDGTVNVGPIADHVTVHAALDRIRDLVMPLHPSARPGTAG